ncbi:hypothetical protein GQ55_4G074300 [Panicum hallii var. hallii]|uniref:Uncharacterized protein n=1 Tax=Panicum hallii var. hallii TaxID=1504633 RepID=A0A2T7DW67_9POAL|nr:hypothetical protein GQ55_4G074300 [Panicum hallii var. hallii]
MQAAGTAALPIHCAGRSVDSTLYSRCLDLPVYHYTITCGQLVKVNGSTLHDRFRPPSGRRRSQQGARLRPGSNAGSSYNEWSVTVLLVRTATALALNEATPLRSTLHPLGARGFRLLRRRGRPVGRNPHLCRQQAAGRGGSTVAAKRNGQPPRGGLVASPGLARRGAWRGTARSRPRPSEGETGARRAMRACDQTAGVRPAGHGHGHGRQLSVRPKARSAAGACLNSLLSMQEVVIARSECAGTSAGDG